ncbi:MAG TPA: endonuclease, partial [Gemmatimonadetes bacterium]|nr:endonuclease [Gemmatimonadota bacterium]
MPFEPTAKTVINLVLEALGENLQPSRVEIEEILVSLLTGAFSSLRPEKENILNVILERTRVWIGPETTLKDAEGHEDWLDGEAPAGPFWERLEDYFLTEREPPLPPSVVKALNRSANKVLGQLESPARDPQWNRRGLVAGSIQSGKTGHYVALAAKALDAGYQIIIILAGVHNSLRSQTQQRVDEQLIGKDKDGNLIGVRAKEKKLKLVVENLPSIVTITTADEAGDFKLGSAQVRATAGTGSRLVIVVKKHVTILTNLTKWLKQTNVLPSNLETGRVVAPTLVIDDEADFASINTTRDPQADPTKTNKLIRQLLQTLECVGFVGYTATPQANIYIPVDVQGDELGPDLFPKAFIHNLKPPSTYIGPDLVFGHPGDESVDIEEQRALPMYVAVDSSKDKKSEIERWMPAKHKKTHIPGPLPGTLREAIRLFVLVVAVRDCRGDKDHNSMLVHVTRFVAVQELVAQKIQRAVDSIVQIICYGGSTERHAQEKALKDVWDRRIVPDHAAFARVSDYKPLPPWPKVWTSVRETVERIRVKQLNGTSEDALDYKNEERTKQVVIAVGGDKLSRGLTLEGLSVSYFLRASRMSDTLMQMGRWFGYRPGYVDLCRVYTTHSLYKAFREFALATDELRRQLDLMAATGKNPTEFGLRIRVPS